MDWNVITNGFREIDQWAVGIGRVVQELVTSVANSMTKQDGAALRQQIDASVDAKIDAIQQLHKLKLENVELKCKADCDAKIAAVELKCKADCDAKIAAVEQKCKADYDAKIAAVELKCKADCDAKIAAVEQKCDDKIVGAKREGAAAVAASKQKIGTVAAKPVDSKKLDLKKDPSVNIMNLKGPSGMFPDPARVRWFLEGQNFLNAIQCKVADKKDWASAEDAHKVSRILNGAGATAGQKMNMGDNWNSNAQYICLCAGVPFVKKPDGKGGKFLSYETGQLDDGSV